MATPPVRTPYPPLNAPRRDLSGQTKPGMAELCPHTDGVRPSCETPWRAAVRHPRSGDRGRRGARLGGRRRADTPVSRATPARPRGAARANRRSQRLPAAAVSPSGRGVHARGGRGRGRRPPPRRRLLDRPARRRARVPREDVGPPRGGVARDFPRQGVRPAGPGASVAEARGARPELASGETGRRSRRAPRREGPPHGRGRGGGGAARSVREARRAAREGGRRGRGRPVALLGWRARPDRGVLHDRCRADVAPLPALAARRGIAHARRLRREPRVGAPGAAGALSAPPPCGAGCAARGVPRALPAVPRRAARGRAGAAASGLALRGVSSTGVWYSPEPPSPPRSGGEGRGEGATRTLRARRADSEPRYARLAMPLIDPAAVPDEVPVLGLNGSVLFPAGTLPLALHTAPAVAAARAALAADGLLAVALRRIPARDGDAIHRVATLAVVQELLGGAAVRCNVHGLARVHLTDLHPGAEHLSARVRVLDDATDLAPAATPPRDRRLRDRLAEEGPDVFPELTLREVRRLLSVPDRAQLADLVLANLPIAAEEKQRGLAERNVETRLVLASSLVDSVATHLAERRGLLDEAARAVRLLVWRAWPRRAA